MTIVIRDGNGKVINIGPWDYQQRVDDDGGMIEENPLPAGATQTDEQVVQGVDGGLYAADDPRKDSKSLTERITAIEARLP